MEEILRLALDTGLIAALFTGLLIYVLRDAKNREQRYQDMIMHLHEKLDLVEEIHEDVTSIKKTIFQVVKKEEKKNEKNSFDNMELDKETSA